MTTVQPPMQRPGFSMTLVQAVLLPVVLGVGMIWLGATVSVAEANTLLIFFLVTIVGMWLCHRTKVALNDANLSLLGTFWLLKLGITIFLLYAGWIPYLDPSSSPSWGYDPQQYFQDAWDLIENDWNPVAGANYQGIIFYYAGIFYLFGHNPIIPALINAFVTLLGTLFLIRCAYSFVLNRTPKDWTLAWLLLVPEVLWYDVMTSRETLMAVLIIVATLVAGRYFVSIQKVSLTGSLLLLGASLFAILVVRTTMAIPVAASIGVMALMLRSHHTMAPVVKVLLVALGITALSAGPLVQQLTGGYDIDYLRTLKHTQSFEDNVAADEDNVAAEGGWSDRSIGMLLIPNSAWQSLLYLPPRMVLYLVAPLPNVAVHLADLIDGSWSAWQRLMTLSTSIAMLLGFPYALAGTARAWQQRRQLPAPLVPYIAFWITFIAVAGGNIIIHERYRLMFTLLLFTCIWLGYIRCPNREVKRWALPWFGLLAAGVVFYVSYKTMG